MPSATLTSKGQITLPAEMRTKLRLVPGSRLDFEEQPDGSFLVRRKTRDIRELKGMLKAPPRVVVSLEDIDRAIGEAIVERFDR